MKQSFLGLDEARVNALSDTQVALWLALWAVLLVAFVICSLVGCVMLDVAFGGD